MVIGLILNFVVFYNIPIPEIADKDLKKRRIFSGQRHEYKKLHKSKARMSLILRNNV